MKLINEKVWIQNGKPVKEAINENGRDLTLAYQILKNHDSQSDPSVMHITFDSLTSHDITYVGIIQTARASGLKEFPVPYVLTNCHNTLCAVGGTINEDDHRFALSAAHKYGGIYVPPNMGVIHSYNREMMSGCGRMILGSDSHTRYGALGTMGVGEGGGELAKQLLRRTWDIQRPEVVLVYMTGEVRPGIGPHDVALALVEATYASGFVKNRVMEFAGPGIASLSQDFRNGVDVMTTETTCLSSIWETDETTQEYFQVHGRPEAYQEMKIQEGACYDRAILVDLNEIESMIALPMHPSVAMSIHALQKDPKRILQKIQDNANQQLSGKAQMNLVEKVDEEGRIHVDQGVIAGCSGGTYENICAAASILKNGNTGNGQFRLSVYPDSMPVYRSLMENGAVTDLIDAGAIFREAFCGPCFGAGDTPANGELSIRHTTRNFPNREGSKPNEGQIAGVCLMDARSIAATAANKGILTAATDVVTQKETCPPMVFHQEIYERRVYNGYGHPEPDFDLIYGPNIKDWPDQPSLKDHILLKIVSHIEDDVTTTDELIPSGETSSYRSNPLRLAEFTLSRRDPSYVPEAKKVAALTTDDLKEVIAAYALKKVTVDCGRSNIASAIYARKPGDGSAREQAASCQRVLGGGANFAREYATKRYRSNCINWGILPFVTEDESVLVNGAWVYVPDVAEHLKNDEPCTGYVLSDGKVNTVTLSFGVLTDDEKQILLDGCLINYYKH